MTMMMVMVACSIIHFNAFVLRFDWKWCAQDASKSDHCVRVVNGNWKSSKCNKFHECIWNWKEKDSVGIYRFAWKWNEFYGIESNEWDDENRTKAKTLSQTAEKRKKHRKSQRHNHNTHSQRKIKTKEQRRIEAMNLCAHSCFFFHSIDTTSATAAATFCATAQDGLLCSRTNNTRSCAHTQVTIHTHTHSV